jgi:hypothetical protein
MSQKQCTGTYFYRRELPLLAKYDYISEKFLFIFDKHAGMLFLINKSAPPDHEGHTLVQAVGHHGPRNSSFVKAHSFSVGLSKNQLSLFEEG